ncbi:MAG: DNA cytosine methyltransferase [Clostridia bacterium]|nr:DNA cytosine methyltransferase [Clostridia bacterium]
MNKLTYISLFSSAGVGCYGFKQEGFNCIATNELISRRLQVQKDNDKCKYESGYICGDILKKDTKDKIYAEIDLWKRKEKIDDITTIIATPPCQGMSVANHKKKEEQARNSLVIESIKLIKDIKPKTFVIENVRAFLNTVCTDIDGKDKKISDAISLNLGEHYNILWKVLNFKDYGSNSSRTRTLVIGVRKDIDIDPEQLFPKKQKEKTIRQVIGDLKSLITMGEIDENDIYHSFRKYSPEMRRWIENLTEGQSAFDNEDKSRLPHYYKNGEKIYCKKKNGDKYTRQYWDKVAPCIHTRNDIFASQNTIHPTDDRVFSVRELMRFMTIPQDFKWTNQTLEELNKLTLIQKQTFIKQNDINIRQSIGEAVPTTIFNQIAKNIKKQI